MTARHTIGVAVTIALLSAACGDGAVSDDGSLGIVTTVSPITNIVANVACSRAVGFGLVPEGVDSHTFSPRPSDAARLADADVVFVNGLSLETPTIRLAESNVRSGVEIVELADRTAPPPTGNVPHASGPSSTGSPSRCAPPPRPCP